MVNVVEAISPKCKLATCNMDHILPVILKEKEIVVQADALLCDEVAWVSFWTRLLNLNVDDGRGWKQTSRPRVEADF